ncbi:MAG TPA: hypothetical protein VMZ30_19990 [Pyrinomonadaceae bacterium]|nr:hypothetical protein [Pyrinomonadaceae bacterium]
MRSIQIRLNYSPRFVYGVLLLLSLLAIALGYYLEKGLHWGSRIIEEPLLGHMVTEIGIAGLVGFVLTLTFERLSAREFRDLAKRERDEIKTDVFHYVYGYSIPRSITDAIDRQILSTPFIRRNMRAEYTLEVIDRTSTIKYVRARREFSYEIENLTDRPQVFSFVASIDQAPLPELNKEVVFTSVKAEDCEQPFTLDESQLLNIQSEKTQEKSLDLGQRIVVLPEITTKVSVVSQTVKHFHGGWLLLILSNHTCDIELRVRVPNRDMEVVAEAYAEKVLKKTKSHDPDLGNFHWNTTNPILAYQGIYIAWTPKELAS